MNSRQTALKYSTYDERIQAYLAFNIGLQIFICCVLATGFVIWLSRHPIYEFLDRTRSGRPFMNWCINFMSWMLLMT